MKWAIIFYAMFSINGEPVEHISWGLTFPHHEQCIDFYSDNEQKIIQGVTSFAENNINQEAVLQEIGCAHATADFDCTSGAALVTLKMPLWQGVRT